MTLLLDVNLLLILHDPLHLHYGLVSQWFAQRAGNSFATCPITQSGFLRLLIRGVPGLAPYGMQEARDALNHLILQSGHVYWPDDPSYLDATRILFARMQGHRQITDAYLLGLAVHNKGKLATLDRGICHLAGREFAACVEVIEK